MNRWVISVLLMICVIAGLVAMAPRDVTHPFTQYPYMTTSSTVPR